MEDKKKKGNWMKATLHTAITKVLTKELSLREAALRYNIPKSTLHDRTSALIRGELFTKVARMDIAEPGFKCTGIYPFDRSLFSDLDYLPADITNIPLEEPGASSNTTDSNEEGPTSVVDLAVAENSISTYSLTSKESMNSPLCSTHETNTGSPKPSTSIDQDVSKSMGLQYIINNIQVSNSRPSTSRDPEIIQTVHKLSPLPDAAKQRSIARKRKSEIVKF